MPLHSNSVWPLSHRRLREQASTTKRFIGTLFSLNLFFAMHGSAAYERDAAQVALEQLNAAAWQQEDELIDRRLAALGEQFGPPNIVFVLGDDIGWGDLGVYGGGKLRGAPTPTLDQLAADGMRFLQHYSEPLCTPSRVALMTGRHPVRTGLTPVLWPGQRMGLVAEEVTLAELLSAAGYRTAMYGKWHLGENPENQPTNQGFDYAFYTLYNGGPWPWAENAEYFSRNEVVGETPFELDIPTDYEQRYGIPIHGIMESRKGEQPREVAELSLERYNRHDNELTDKILDFIEEQSAADRPFFVYFATNAQQIFACPPEVRYEKYVDSANCQAAQLVQHDRNVGRIRDKLEALGIERNTLLVWASDNGPEIRFYPSVGFSYLRGEKGEVTEGGVRTPAIAWWPGMIAPGSDPMDLVHLTDWYTTIARLAGVQGDIPGDRVIDGANQTSLLVNGEGHSRRDYIFHYRGSRLAAVRWNHLKLHLASDTGGVTGGGLYNIIRDPEERFSGERKRFLWATVPFNELVRAHQDLMRKFPNRSARETMPSVEGTE